ncbi:MAG TPA: hypothetical protein VGC42_30225, partial [Kofleriaceae bacterium]
LILFSSNRGSGSNNLWYATRTDVAQPFGAPAQVPTVNSAVDEGDPFLSEDGCTLYFSRRNATFDLYKAVASAGSMSR